ncbi:MAG: DNA repair protein RecN, partial [Thermomicrobiales bacterium]
HALRGATEQLPVARRRAAATLTAAVQRVIRDLQLGSASFSIDVTPRVKAGAPLHPSVVEEHGVDDVEIMFAPNKGEQPRPLSRIASGGEMARMMLALKATLASANTIPTYVFDEVDVGVGGRSGIPVGERLYELSQDRQVLVISHLPQVAGFADRHFRISKREDVGRTHSVIEQLDDDERIEELAAMFDGEPPTDASRANARDMLERISALRSHLSDEDISGVA